VDAAIRPLALTGFLPAWDIERRRVDASGIVDWALDRIRHLGHRAVDLDTLHHHLDAAAALAVAQTLTAASLAEDLRRVVHRAVLQAIPEIEATRVWIQTHTHFRILVPHGTAAVVPPHTDHGFGHGLSERNVWISLTDAEGSAALHVLSLRESLSWQARTGKLHGVLEGTPEILPVPTRAGDVLLFTPLHVHRARPPAGDRCRVSVDIRLVPRLEARRDLTFSPLYGDP
jgi:ectoine hydroxylase-related dioxygenase (phytanoyl-CoA dioxygenase family)